MSEELNIKDKIHTEVSNYYGEEIKNSTDLKTNACCSTDSMPFWQKDILKKIESEILDKFYGCGSPIPEALDGKVLLDIGCGTGRDVYIASNLVGENGKVIGIDMTDEQLKVAQKYIKVQTEKYGYKNPNVEFRKGYIEDLKSCGIADNSVDAVISNCVINLAEDKESVFKETFRVLKPGGELYFFFFFSDRRIPQHLKNDPLLYGECLSNAMYIEDFRRILISLGINDYRIVSKRKINIDNQEIENKIGFVNFYSYSIRTFKIYSLEDKCEDYGQIAKYLGTIKNFPNNIKLDDHHIFETDKPMLVCGNTFDMLKQSRFSSYFEFIGNKSKHFGLFPCGTPKNIDDPLDSSTSCC